MVARRHAVAVLATFIPANMVWVFFACALQCVAAAGTACGPDESDSCCRPLVVESHANASMSVTGTDTCLIVPGEPAVTTGRKSPAEGMRVGAVGYAVDAEAIASGARSIVPENAPDPPPKRRPFDRLPILRV